jgi:DNA-binding LacI/PurR family transcriptional regulator
MAAHLDVPLTTVAQDSYLLGKTAAEMLINRIEGTTGAPTITVIPTQLRIRSSTSLPIRV